MNGSNWKSTTLWLTVLVTLLVWVMVLTGHIEAEKFISLLQVLVPAFAAKSVGHAGASAYAAKKEIKA